MNIRSPQRSHREQGNALLIAVVLLLLASVITLLSLNVGLIEQRTSGVFSDVFVIRLGPPARMRHPRTCLLASLRSA